MMGEEAGSNTEIKEVVQKPTWLDHPGDRVHHCRHGDPGERQVGEKAAKADRQQQERFEVLDNGEVDQPHTDDDHDQLADAIREIANDLDIVALDRFAVLVNVPLRHVLWCAF